MIDVGDIAMNYDGDEGRKPKCVRAMHPRKFKIQDLQKKEAKEKEKRKPASIARI